MRKYDGAAGFIRLIIIIMTHLKKSERIEKTWAVNVIMDDGIQTFVIIIIFIIIVIIIIVFIILAVLARLPRRPFVHCERRAERRMITRLSTVRQNRRVKFNIHVYIEHDSVARLIVYIVLSVVRRATIKVFRRLVTSLFDLKNNPTILIYCYMYRQTYL